MNGKWKPRQQKGRKRVLLAPTEEEVLRVMERREEIEVEIETEKETPWDTKIAD